MFVHCALIAEASPVGYRSDESSVLNVAAGSRRLIYRGSSFDCTLSRTCFFLVMLFPFCSRFSMGCVLLHTILPGA